MHLSRVKVPDFRVLKNVDITFEKGFVPNIFPVGGQNGSGKSTFLQLIFTLLHCSLHAERAYFLQNLLIGFSTTDKRVLAEFEIVDGDDVFEIEFFVASGSYTDKVFKRLVEDNTYESIPQEQPIGMCTSLANGSNEINRLYWRVKNWPMEKEGFVLNVLEMISNKIFLAAPPTQVYLFLNQETKNILFTKLDPTVENGKDYFSELNEAKKRLPGFFTYDFFTTELLVKYLNEARDKDFNEFNKTGVYGTGYVTLLKEINNILLDKKVKLRAEKKYEIVFEIDKDGETIELNPEDLSHGELKRLSLYVWLKYNKIEDAIVLMDEIEMGLHPDWQYRITDDLSGWAPGNQYILATHSYDLCEGVTPSHVKVLEPNFLKKAK